MRGANDTIRNLLHLVTELDRACTSLLDSQVGLTHDEARALLELDASQEPLRPGELAKRLQLQPSAVSRMLRNLEERGFIERQRVVADARSLTVHLTEKGSQAAMKVSTRLEEYFAGLSRQLELTSLDALKTIFSDAVGYTLDFQDARKNA